MRFPFTFMGGMTLGIGLWIVAYLALHRNIDSASRDVALGTAVLCFGFGVYVVIRRLRHGPQH